MTPKPISLRRIAREDLDQAVLYYLAEASARVALEFSQAFQATYGRMEAAPRAGSPRHEHRLGIPGLRVLAIGRYPYVIFYVERSDHIDILRILHTASNFAVWLDEAN